MTGAYRASLYGRAVSTSSLVRSSDSLSLHNALFLPNLPLKEPTGKCQEKTLSIIFLRKKWVKTLQSRMYWF